MGLCRGGERLERGSSTDAWDTGILGADFQLLNWFPGKPGRKSQQGTFMDFVLLELTVGLAEAS